MYCWQSLLPLFPWREEPTHILPGELRTRINAAKEGEIQSHKHQRVRHCRPIRWARKNLYELLDPLIGELQLLQGVGKQGPIKKQ